MQSNLLFFSTRYSAGIYLLLRSYLAIPPNTPVVHGDMDCMVNSKNNTTHPVSQKNEYFLKNNPPPPSARPRRRYPPVRLPYARSRPGHGHHGLQIRRRDKVTCIPTIFWEKIRFQSFEFPREYIEIAKGNPQWPQAFYPTEKNVTVSPTDFLVARCTYNSTGVDHYTQIGERTSSYLISP